MAALNTCRPTQLLILHIIKFLIYTLCFCGPAHNSLVLNSRVVKISTHDRCWFLYLFLPLMLHHFVKGVLFFNLVRGRFSYSATKIRFYSLVFCTALCINVNISGCCKTPTNFSDGTGKRKLANVPTVSSSIIS